MTNTSHCLHNFSLTRRWRTEPVSPADYPIFSDLFYESFGYKMSVEEWRWKYGPHSDQAVFAYQGERAIAHYGCLTQRVLVFGEPAFALQPVDVVVSPRERGILTRHGPMFLAATTLFGCLLGPGRKHALGMGFPTTRHLQLAERLGLFESAGRLVELSWRPTPRCVDAHIAIVDALSMTPDTLNRYIQYLWKRMTKDLKGAAVVIRDFSRIHYRFLSHPTKRYHVFIVKYRLIPIPIGLLVLRIDENRCEWVDSIAPLASLPQLVQIGRFLASRLGTDDLYVWVAEQFIAPFLSTSPGFKVTDIHNLAITWVPTKQGGAVKERWWLMGGDTDFR